MLYYLLAHISSFILK